MALPHFTMHCSGALRRWGVTRLGSLALIGSIACIPSAPSAAQETASSTATADASTAASEAVDSEPTPTESVAPSAMGSVIFVDPTTGQLTAQPTPEQEAWWAAESQRLGKRLQRPVELAPRPFALQGGGEGLFLDDFIVSATVLMRDINGHWVTACGHGDVSEPHRHTADGIEFVTTEESASAEATEPITSTDAAPVM